MDSVLEQALDYHKAGKLVDAARLCARVLEAKPTSAAALHLLGVIGTQLEQLESAAACLEMAVRHDPTVPGYFNDLGLVQRKLNLPNTQAIRAFEQALERDPGYIPAHINLGNLLRDLGRREEAISHYSRVTELDTTHAGAHRKIAVLLAEAGRYAEAEPHFRRVAELRPDSLSAQLEWVKILRDVGKLVAAEEHCRATLKSNPVSAVVLNELGVTLSDQGQYEAAESCLRRALQIDPNDAQSHCNIGHLFLLQRRFVEAISSLHQALEQNTDFGDAWNNLAGATQGLALASDDEEGLRDAERYYRRALEVKADAADVHVNLGMLCLMQGRYAEGWSEYGWRLKAKCRPRSFPQPLWRGESLVGSTILLHVEQGLGDTLQFLRFIPQVKRLGARVVLLCQTALAPLLRGAVGIDVLLDDHERLPWFDCHAPLLNLPEMLGVFAGNSTEDVPYIFPSPERVAHWKTELAGFEGLRVGIVWQGNPAHTGDRWRSLTLEQFEPLFTVPSVHVFSLQSGFGTEQLSEIDCGLPIVNLDLPFHEKAAAIVNLDLVISCDTAVAHLAGALGQAVWVAIPKIPDWRWLTKGETTPWYPSMRLYRQKTPNDWGAVMERICDDVTQMALQSQHS
jgi:tetratricopeptide (TPR) repeat protein